MRVTTRTRPFVCLPCQLLTGRPYIATELFHANAHSQSNKKKQLKKKSTRADPLWTPVKVVENRQKAHVGPSPRKNTVKDVAPVQGQEKVVDGTPLAYDGNSEREQREHLNALLRQRLSQGSQDGQNIRDGSLVDETDRLLKELSSEVNSADIKELMMQVDTKFTGTRFEDVWKEIDTVNLQTSSTSLTNSSNKVASSEGDDAGSVQTFSNSSFSSMISADVPSPKTESTATVDYRPSLASQVVFPVSATRKSAAKQKLHGQKIAKNASKSTQMRTINAQDLKLASFSVGEQPDLPQLRFDLSRVLFNPGVYQLRDPRSRVYNFDPYLEQPMPLSEFNFQALPPYITSSKDTKLIELAQVNQKRYIGSSSSMTAALSQFHFLLSHWRELNIDRITRGFIENHRGFTALTRLAAAIFLRYKDGVYAVDADKEYDEPNVLMSLGKSLEKFLTLKKEEFEKWRRRKSESDVDHEPPKELPDVFHYSQQGKFLLRSQLDAWDPRLPGNGYFDLKTRAVAGIRMNIREHEAGMGYQIKDLFGTWESYEREVYDMMRSTYLKYSLQVRMGAMDGIFVAYHNITRMFGFQYIPITDMDLALHGQSDPCLGDQEYGFSIKLMEEIFDKATEAYPERSLRVHFEAREPTPSDPTPCMYIFIEPMTEEQIQTVQDTQKAQHEVFERKLFQGEDVVPDLDEGEGLTEVNSEVEVKDEKEGLVEEDEEEDNRSLPENTIVTGSLGPASSNANQAFLESIFNAPRSRIQPPPPEHEMLAFKLTVQNQINDRPVTRPDEITSVARWSIDYTLEELTNDVARKQYTSCRNRRRSALQSVMTRGSDNYFIRSMRQMSEKGAEWRRKQDELDAQNERKVLYGERASY